MTSKRNPSYQSSARKFSGAIERRQLEPETELDSLLEGLKSQKRISPDGKHVDPLDKIREITIQELVPTFVELVEKYSDSGISMQMDASSFLEGGREIKFEFGINGHRISMIGTVTTEAIAFHETRYSPNVDGELLSGPMLRLRGLNSEVFRQFICERLTTLIRDAMR